MTTEKEQLEAEIAERDARIAELIGARDHLRLQASMQAQEARTQKAIVAEIGAMVGEPCDWLTASAVRKALKAQQASAVHLLFDGPPGPECGRFVEAEDPTGKSVNAGEWSQRPDGYWQLVIQQPSAGVACALMSALEGIVHDQRVPNEVSQECAAVLIEARRLNPCRAQAVPDGWVMVPAVATDHMTWVGQSMRHDTEISIGSIYCAMLAAAPYAQQKESGDE